jgi:deoxyribodipyrimidine photo-lyase
MSRLRLFPALRVRPMNRRELRPERDFVLYWMTAFRRAQWNFALDRAVDWAVHLNKPLVVLEPLRCDYPWASDRVHTFVLQGMADNCARLARHPVTYYPYVEPTVGAERGLLAALAGRACIVVGDDYPGCLLPKMVAAAGRSLDVPLEAVDGNGVIALRAADRVFTRAVDFRRFVQRELLAGPEPPPRARPFAQRWLPRLGAIPDPIIRRWPPADAALLAPTPAALSRLPIDHEVAGVDRRGGAGPAQTALRRFVRHGLAGYDQHRNHPDDNATSRLSPYLHFGHLSAHQVLFALARAESWSPARLVPPADGRRAGWLGMSRSGEAFFDQLVIWRELGFNMCWQQADYDRYSSLPDWARATLAAHAGDPRPYLYSLQQFECAATHDALWNAAQRQLLGEGHIHGYLRMLWGKKILEWSRSPQRAADIMIQLNNRYALDGRDPNSYSGIFWVLGRYDRPWAPERPVFGRVRYMTSASAARKLRLDRYLEHYSTVAAT